MIDLVGFDGDDTLWHSEDYYRQAEAEFLEIVDRWIDLKRDDLHRRLYTQQQQSLALYGYGAKSMTLAMVETAISMTEGAISAADIGRIVALGREILEHPVQLLPGIRAAVGAVAQHYRVVLITKGDLLHQERKIEQSGLTDLFQHIAIVSDKSPRDYARVLAGFDTDASRFAMVGNSLRSDIEPVIALGGWGIHMPYHVTWEHERHHGLEADHPRLAAIDGPSQIAQTLHALGSGPP